jgi:hypothetical protein
LPLKSTFLLEVSKQKSSEWCLVEYYIQWKPLNVITVNVMFWLMWSINSNYWKLIAHFYSQLIWKPIRLCYHWVNVISFSLSQSDHIKWLPLYLVQKAPLIVITLGWAISDNNKQMITLREHTLCKNATKMIC